MNGQTKMRCFTETCKICGGDAPIHGVVDFNKSCEEQNGTFMTKTREPVYYNRCTQCKLLFTTDFDDKDQSWWKRKIYNDDYIKADPEYVTIRPTRNADNLVGVMKQKNITRALDYGGGNGVLAARLRELGFDAHSYDKFVPSDILPDLHSFPFITSFEVLEHTNTPVETVEDMISYLTPDGCIIFSTLCLEGLPEGAMDHWYIAPRNGHVTIYTLDALRRLFAKVGMKVRHFNTGVHIAEWDVKADA